MTGLNNQRDGERAERINRDNDQRRDQNGERIGASRIANIFDMNGVHLQSGVTKKHPGSENKIVEIREVGNQVFPVDVNIHRAAGMIIDDAKNNQQRSGRNGADKAAPARDDRYEPHAAQRTGRRRPVEQQDDGCDVIFVGGERFIPVERWPRESQSRTAIDQTTGKPDGRLYPENEYRQKSPACAEGLAHPAKNAAAFGPASGEFRRHQSKRHKKEHGGENIIKDSGQTIFCF